MRVSVAEGQQNFLENEAFMATKQARGTKRTCQNPECDSRFYDLNKDPIVCPLCETIYKLAPEQIEAEEEEVVVEAVAAKPAEAASTEADDGSEIEEDDALVSLEEADEDVEDTTTSDDEEDTFLEDDDDDDGDVSDILGAPVAGDDEES